MVHSHNNNVKTIFPILFGCNQLTNHERRKQHVLVLNFNYAHLFVVGRLRGFWKIWIDWKPLYTLGTQRFVNWASTVRIKLIKNWTPALFSKLNFKKFTSTLYALNSLQDNYIHTTAMWKVFNRKMLKV
jgi:hypothetical protein